ncbi:MAG: rod shape-determining protein MreC [Campylobacterota bacterium]|nr:rod shape-determining protein MreC [Campylobacterota bacterium]
MKTKIIAGIILLLVITVLLTKNDKHISNMLLGFINPMKQNYQNITQDLEDKSHSYIFQKESIEKLSIENRILRKRLLEQTHYIKQVKNIYDVLPNLSKLPAYNISIAETISYVKLNSFSQIILTKPKNLIEDKLYGLIQGTVVSGVAMVKNNQLYGYLTSDVKCRFSVFLGKNKAPGIASGLEKNRMIIKFIPKWHKIEKGDKVITSGLDNIFFADLPVGVVTDIEVHSSYKVAHIKTYSDILHPKTFFLINDAEATLIQGYDSNSTKFNFGYNITRKNSKDNNESNLSTVEHNQTLPIISSIPSRIDQTKEEVVVPETPIEKVIAPKKKKKRKIKKKPKKVKKVKYKSTDLDLF